MQAATVTNTSDEGPDDGPIGPVVPFVRASFEHTEPANIDETRTLSSSSQLIGPVDVPSYGYLRSLLVLVEATGGTGSAAVAEADGPWSVLNEIALHDVNGAPIFGPLTGYQAYLTNKWGGYAAHDDPASHPSYSAIGTDGNFSFLLRIPVEIGNRDGLGSLPNMNASSTYKLRMSLAPLGSVYSTDPTGIPDVNVRVWAECWAPPSAGNDLGQQQAVQPPALGTTQMWTVTSPSVNSGQNQIRLPRVGNLIRNIVLVHRDTSGDRSEANLPDTLQLYHDGRLVTNEALAIRRGYMSERFAGATADNGVVVYDYTHDFDGRAGGELRDGWMQTATSTRLELQGSFGAAGSLEIITNDVAPVGNVYLD